MSRHEDTTGGDAGTDEEFVDRSLDDGNTPAAPAGKEGKQAKAGKPDKPVSRNARPGNPKSAPTPVPRTQ